MKYDIRHPLTESEKTTIAIDPDKGKGQPYVAIHVGQEPTLTEMYDSILWTAQNLNPDDAEFEIDPSFAGEQEYNQVFQYLNSAGFRVKTPEAKKVVVPVPVFNEEDVMIAAPDGTPLSVPPVPDDKNFIRIGDNRFTDYRSKGEVSYGRFEPGELVSMTPLNSPMSLRNGILLGAAGVVLTSLLTFALLKGN